MIRVRASSLVQRLVGVYDADGSARGELSYVLRSLVGRTHCALCDVTHGRIRERGDWRACRERLPVPFVMYHRDGQPAPIREASGGRVPVVTAEMTDGCVVVLMGPDELERCAGSPERLVRAVEQAVTDAGLTWARS